MSKTYFIDSENVGDYWVSLLAAISPEDRLLVFYTSRSPHMSYRNLIALKESNRDVTFIECFEGSNALDFQLCSELGYRLHDIDDGEFIIVSNDMGFDAAVRYWRRQNHAVQRIPGKACLIMKNAANAVTTEESVKIQIPTDTANDSNIASTLMESFANETVAQTPAELSEPQTSDNLKFDGTMPEEDALSPVDSDIINQIQINCDTNRASMDTVIEETASAEQETISFNAVENTPADVTEENPSAVPKSISAMDAQSADLLSFGVVADDTAKEILYLIGKKNLQDLHEALIQLYGAETGMGIYNLFKSGNDYNRFLADHPQLSLSEKQALYCKIVFSMETPAMELPDNFSDFLMKAWAKKKNLNSLRAALQTEYGKGKSEKYYSIMKAHVKLLARLK